MNEPLLTYQNELSANILMLCRFLRQKGYSIGPNAQAEALQILSTSRLNDKNSFKLTLKAIFAKNRFQFEKFDDYFDLFWHEYVNAKDSKLKLENDNAATTKRPKTKEAQFQSIKDWLKLSQSEEEQTISSYSTLEVLAKKDFSDLSIDEMQHMMHLIKKLARKIAHQQSRLRRQSKIKKTLDMNRTVRASMRRGGNLGHFYYSRKKDRKLKLVLLCDVSRSMELYSKYFTHLIYAFQNSYDRIETFVFSTALHRVTEILANLEFKLAFDKISESVPHWSGGTTIGNCLKDFTDHYAHSVIDKKTVVLILSDGWDTGSPMKMRDSMHFLHKHSKKVIWLNPLSGSPNFSPEAIGLKTALPYIDALCPAHNLASLELALLQISTRRNLLKGNLLFTD